MGIKTIKKLYFRFILLIVFSIFLAYDKIYHTNFIYTLINKKFANMISILHIFWIFLAFEMLIVVIPNLNHYSYSGKHLMKHYLAVPKFDIDKLIEFTKQNGIKALRSAIFWIVFNTPFTILFFLGYLDSLFFYWLFFLYYFFDTVCINIFCIFHVFIVRNKCCNDCRIYNWGNFMYCTPLMFIPNVWNYSLVFLSIIILIQWETSAHNHPERFSPISNLSLQCQHCPHDCRYQSSRHPFIQSINKIGHTLYRKFKKQEDRCISSKL